MATSILKTKLYMPPVRPNLVPRPRLIEKLNAGMDCKLILISAPAGFGKTTLVIDWLSKVEWPSTCLGLDENDNDLARFLSYFTAALQEIEPNLGQTATRVSEASKPQATEPLLTTLINEMAALGTPFVFVFEDYHVVSQPAIHEAIAFLLEHIPPQMHLVINSRTDPPLPLSRLRASRQMTEIRGADLRFTEPEVAVFFNQTIGLNLSPEAVKAVENRTEGWIAGLQLAALSMENMEDADREASITAMTGSDRYILDYLIEEVLDRQPLHVKNFLLQTSILERLSVSLCEAILSNGEDHISPFSGQKMLEYLEQNNLFLIPLDNKRQWYRYHHLFADLLRNQLGVSQPDLMPTLHRRASAWYEQYDFMSEAIAHSLVAEDFTRAAELTERTFMDMCSRAEFFTTMLTRLEALPEEIIRVRPQLGIMYAWMLSISLQVDAVEPRLQEVERMADGQLPADLQRQIASIRAELSRHHRDFARAIELSHQILEALPKDPSGTDLQTLTGVVFNLALAYRQKGDAIRAQQWSSEALRISQAAGSLTLTLSALNELSRAHELRGRLHQAAGIYGQGLQLADEAAREIGQAATAAVYIHIGLGDLFREWDKLEEAEHHLAQGIEMGQKWQIDGNTLRDGYFFQARVRQAQGDMAGAMGAIQQAEQLAQAYRSIPRFGDPIAACRVRLALAEAASTGNASCLQATEQWVRERQLETDGSRIPAMRIDSLNDELDYLTWVRLLIAQNEPERAFQLLDHLLQAAEEGGRTGRVIEVLALQALAQQALNHTEEALTILKRALSLAEPEGYVRLFLDEGLPMVKLLRQAASHDIALNYVAKLLFAFSGNEGERVFVKDKSGLTPTHPSSIMQPVQLLDPLSKREVEVLRLLSTDLSWAEIADTLYVSLNTVKTHIKNIYSKLNVHSRFEAIDLAKKLNLIP